jgi:Protein of unknown function (DUF2752)
VRLKIASAGASFTLVNAVWEKNDRHRTWTRLALLGVPLTGLLAVLGLPSIDIHGPLHYLGVMGPTCGMTRGVMWFARGNLARAWMFNPGSFLVAPAMVVVLSRAFYGYLTGRWLALSLRWRPWLWVVPTLLVALLAIRQQLYIQLLLANPAG